MCGIISMETFCRIFEEGANFLQGVQEPTMLMKAAQI